MMWLKNETCSKSLFNKFKTILKLIDFFLMRVHELFEQKASSRIFQVKSENLSVRKCKKGKFSIFFVVIYERKGK